MSVFDIDTTGARNTYENALGNPVWESDLKPSWYSGAWKAPFTGLASTVNDAALLLGDAATPSLRMAVRPVDQLFGTNLDDWLKGQQQVAVDNIKAWSPDPRTTGWLGMAGHGLANIIPEAILGGPETAAALQGYKGFRRGMAQEGLDPITALGQGTIEGVSTYLGMLAPMSLGSSAKLWQNVGFGTAVNVATGATTRGVISGWLEHRGYTDLASQYRILDGEAMMVDAIMGAGFGALGHYFHGKELPQRRMSDILPSDMDAALAANNHIHMEVDTLPGLPTDPIARQAHVDALNKALEDLMMDREVNVDPAVTEAKFEPKPANGLRETFDQAIAEHMGPEWQKLQQELRARGLLDNPDLYARGTALDRVGTAAEISSAVREAFKGEGRALEESGRVKVVETTGELPPRPDGAPHPADVMGYFDGERVHIVAENVRPGEVPGVMLHEIGAHYGMENMLGRQLYRQVLSEVEAKARAGVDGFRQALEAVPLDTPAGRVKDEVLAYLVQNQPELPMIQRLLSELRQFIYRITGGRLIDLKADDLRAMAVASLKQVSAAEAKQMGLLPVEPVTPAYARAKPGVEQPGVGTARENLNGFEPDLRVKVPVGRMTLPEKPLVLTGTNMKNAARQIAGIDETLAKFPDADKSPLEWSKMMAYAMATDDVPVPPYRFLTEINSDGAVRKLETLTSGQIADADHGFENARLFREAYMSGRLDVETTGKLFMWSFLSRGVSPYTQEGLFIDAYPGIDKWIKKASAGELTEADFGEYEEWARSVAPKGSGQPGSGATHNLNAFGKLFLFKMGEKGEDGKSKLQHMHDMMSDPNMTGRDIRRWFIANTEGVGIDNKVVSFTLLVAGFPDVMVLDRVQIRQLWDDGRFGDRNLYDGRKVDGKPVAGSALAEITYGARGLLIYEAVERALGKRIENIYTALGRPEAASIGRYHWETWVADSQQEASHGTLDAILHDARGNPEMIAEVTAKEGEYGAYQYGARYGRTAVGEPYFLYQVGNGPEFRFSVEGFREFMDAIKLPANGVIPKPTPIKVDGKTKYKNFSVTEAGNAPWYERPEVNKTRIEELAAEYAVGSEGGGEGAVQAPRPGEALSDRTGRADPYSAETIIANRPDLTIVQDDGTMVPAGRALVQADEEIATAKKDSQAFDAAAACALRG